LAAPIVSVMLSFVFFFQAEDGIRDLYVTGVQTCALPISAAAFIPDPFGEDAGARLYRTGDVARYLADGQIEFLGRRDQQVKVRGFRIELGEIETTLREHEGVREAVVAARDGAHGDTHLT